MNNNFYHIITYGCQMNIHESEKIAGILQKLGYVENSDPKQSKIVVFNTCCIRENAEHRAEGNIGALKAYKTKNPDVIIAVCGCMSQQEQKAEKLKAKFPFIDIILGTHNIDKLEEYVLKIAGKAKSKNYLDVVSNGEYIEINEQIPVYRTSGTNAWVNIMYGCNNFCTYCIVPYVRGRERSRDIKSIIKEVEELLKQGYLEITLLGQNVNSYGNDLQNEKINFAILLEQLAKLPFSYRLRFMTSHPKDLTDDVINVIAKYDNITKYIHLPVQAGSTNVLNAMNRKYTAEQYLQLVEKIYAKIPNVKLTSDIMVGFPGETEQDFLQTLKLVEACKFSNAFTFIYSRRSGTVADKMQNQIDESTQSERIGRLIKIQNAIAENDGKQYIGNNYEVLVEDLSNKNDKIVVGRTDCNKLVSMAGDSSMIGKIANVKITKSKGPATLCGDIVGFVDKFHSTESHFVNEI